MKYKIGDKVWWASWKAKEEWVKCQECFGLKYLTVILGDQSEVRIECEACRKGYLGSMGSVSYWKKTAEAKIVTINRIEVKSDKIEYGVDDSYSVDENDLFSIGDRELAEIRALELSESLNNEEVSKIYRKIKDYKSWSWHVHYHRKCIRDAEKQIIYHTSCLNYAKTKSKEPEVNC